MPLGGQAHGVATGPSIGPRTIDPQAAAYAGMSAAPVGVGSFGLVLPPTLRTALIANAPGQQIHSGPCTLYGWTLAPQAGEGPTFVVIFDGNSIDDPVVGIAVSFGMPAWFDKGVAIHTGLFMAWNDIGPPAGALYFN